MLEYRTNPDENGLRVVACRYCAYKRLTHWPKEQVNHTCTRPAEWWMFGGWVRHLLSKIGITQRRYLWLRSKLGLKPSCTCLQREQSLNTLGARFKQGLLGIWGKIRAALWNKE